MSICSGRLIIEPASKKQVPEDWYRKNELGLVQVILKSTSIDGYRYVGYSTGLYGKKKTGGVTLQFKGLLTNSDAYSIFNAETTRVRTTKHGKKGSLLPKGQFRVGVKSNFYKFWQCCGLKARGNSVYHQYMGNLKGLTFALSEVTKGRVQNYGITPLELDFTSIYTSILGAPLASKVQVTDKQLTSNAQVSNASTDMTSPQATQGLQPTTATYKNNYGNTVPSYKVIREAGTTLDIPIGSAEVHRWLEAYQSD